MHWRVSMIIAGQQRRNIANYMETSKQRYNTELQKECKRLKIIYPFLTENQIQRKAKEVLHKKKNSFYLR